MRCYASEPSKSAMGHSVNFGLDAPSCSWHHLDSSFSLNRFNQLYMDQPEGGAKGEMTTTLTSV